MILSFADRSRYNDIAMEQSPTTSELQTDSNSSSGEAMFTPINDVTIDTHEDDPENQSFKRFLIDAVETIAIAVGIFFVIYTFIAQPHQVKGESMQPNYFEDEYILTSKMYTWLGTPERGDVIVLKSPDNANEQFIKRIIGLPGEKIKVEDNKVTIVNNQHPNGFVLQESYLPANLPIPDGAFLREGDLVQIPDNNYVVMGDNRPASYDSRNWGLLSKDKIIGKAFFVYWPLTSFGFVAHAEYND